MITSTHAFFASAIELRHLTGGKGGRRAIAAHRSRRYEEYMSDYDELCDGRFLATADVKAPRAARIERIDQEAHGLPFACICASAVAGRLVNTPKAAAQLSLFCICNSRVVAAPPGAQPGLIKQSQ